MYFFLPGRPRVTLFKFRQQLNCNHNFDILEFRYYNMSIVEHFLQVDSLINNMLLALQIMQVTISIIQYYDTSIRDKLLSFNMCFLYFRKLYNADCTILFFIDLSNEYKYPIL